VGAALDRFEFSGTPVETRASSMRTRRWEPDAGLAAYGASKHGVVGLVRSVAISVAKEGVRVNALCPGMVDTALLRRLTDAQPSLREGLLALKPMGRLGELEEIAAAAVWLASDESSFVTGHALAVDGGYAAQ
jgi:NAD(P)-dependent dehydrogenase (short-subunit alcohol dehydrogenase family)